MPINRAAVGTNQRNRCRRGRESVLRRAPARRESAATPDQAAPRSRSRIVCTSTRTAAGAAVQSTRNVARLASDIIISTPTSRSTTTVATASVRRPGESLAAKIALNKSPPMLPERDEVQRESKCAEPHRVAQAKIETQRRQQHVPAHEGQRDRGAERAGQSDRQQVPGLRLVHQPVRNPPAARTWTRR